MSRICSVCQHLDVDTINQAIVEGEPHTALAEEFGLSPSAVWRHSKSHVPMCVVPGSGTPIPLRGILWRLADIMERSRVIEDEAHEKGSLGLCLRAQRDQVRIAERVLTLAIMVEEREHFLSERKRKTERVRARQQARELKLPFEHPKTLKGAEEALTQVLGIVKRGRSLEGDGH